MLRFCLGKWSPSPLHTDYVPSKFAFSKPGSEVRLSRYERRMERSKCKASSDGSRKRKRPKPVCSEGNAEDDEINVELNREVISSEYQSQAELGVNSNNGIDAVSQRDQDIDNETGGEGAGRSQGEYETVEGHQSVCDELTDGGGQNQDGEESKGKRSVSDDGQGYMYNDETLDGDQSEFEGDYEEIDREGDSYVDDNESVASEDHVSSNVESASENYKDLLECAEIEICELQL